ncbi:hypothetical protein [Absidia glauca]|uniref:Uncharacterized protein n=1 Tax=Absidia glauca TaxID=4829 RepID=A0A168S9B1_ABSGL|nr:hypothetical protein [Absidia glauca]
MGPTFQTGRVAILMGCAFSNGLPEQIVKVSGQKQQHHRRHHYHWNCKLPLNKQSNINNNNNSSRQQQHQQAATTYNNRCLSRSSKQQTNGKVSVLNNYRKGSSNDKMMTSTHRLRQMTATLLGILTPHKPSMISNCPLQTTILNSIMKATYTTYCKIEIDTMVMFLLIFYILSLRAASSILFVTPNRIPDDLVNVFGGEQQMDSFIDNLQSKNDMNSRRNSRLPMKLISHLTSIVEDVLVGTKSRNQGICSLLSMEGKVFTTDGELIVFEEEEIPVPDLILPNKVIMEDIKEHELCTRYLDPVLCGYFDNPSESADHLNLESKKSALVSKRRPDSCLTRLNGVKYGTTLACGEVKCASASAHLYDICKDTLRIGIFCKNALDVGKMKGILGIQAVGRTITFYLMNLLSDGLYTMLELTSITIPGSTDDLLKYLMELSKWILTKSSCKPSAIVPPYQLHLFAGSCPPPLAVAANL